MRMRARWLVASCWPWRSPCPARRPRRTSETTRPPTCSRRHRPRRTPKEPAPPPSVTVIGARDAHGMLGRDVRSAADENMGRIVDVIVDRAGTVRAAVIDFGGFLGVGSRKIVVDWNALRFGAIANKNDSITLELTKEQVSRPRPNTRRIRRSSCSAPPAVCNPGNSITERRSSDLVARPFHSIARRSTSDRRRRPRRADNVVPRSAAAGIATAAVARRASAASTGSSSSSPTCRPALVPSSRST